MSVGTMNFNSVEVCGPPPFKHSLSHQIKKLMCYNRHMVRKTIINSATINLDSVSQQNNIYNTSQADARPRYDNNQISIRTNSTTVIEQNVPNQKLDDILDGVVTNTLSEFPRIGTSDVQQVLPLYHDRKSEKRTECQRSTQNRCRQAYYSKNVASGNSIYSPEPSYRRSLPPLSGVYKQSFCDLPSSSDPYRQRNAFHDTDIDSLTPTEDFQSNPMFSYESAIPKIHRNSAFQLYHRDEFQSGNKIIKHLPIMEEPHSSEYNLDFPLHSSSEKLTFLDGPTSIPDSRIMEKCRPISSYQTRHEELPSLLYSNDLYDENIPKSQYGHSISNLIPENEHSEQSSHPCSQISQKRKQCVRMNNNDVYHQPRKHHASCSKTNISNILELSTPAEKNMDEFQLENNYNMDTESLNSPTSTINSADITFDLSQSSDFSQDQPCTSAPQRRGPGRPRKPENERKRKPTKSIPLWKFLLNMLHDPATCPELVRWEDTSKGTFRIVRSDVVAAKWGMRKDNTKMNYEKFSRAMRYYYKQHIFEAVPGKRLVYQFGKAAKDWRPKNMNNPNFDKT